MEYPCQVQSCFRDARRPNPLTHPGMRAHTHVNRKNSHQERQHECAGRNQYIRATSSTCRHWRFIHHCSLARLLARLVNKLARLVNKFDKTAV